jgi:hypothetical protein
MTRTAVSVDSIEDWKSSKHCFITTPVSKSGRLVGALKGHSLSSVIRVDLVVLIVTSSAEDIASSAQHQRCAHIGDWKTLKLFIQVGKPYMAHNNSQLTKQCQPDSALWITVLSSTQRGHNFAQWLRLVD